jgi:peptide/nickel transport system permease protein
MDGAGPSAMLAARRRRSRLARLTHFLRDFLRSPSAALGAAMLIAITVLAVGAPWIAPTDPFDLTKLDIMDSRLRPGEVGGTGLTHLLGTDDQGRDLWSAILYGLRISLFVGVGAGLIAASLGTLVGVYAAYRGGLADTLIMRVVDFQLSFPAILIALVLLAALGPGIEKVMFALVAVQWAYFARTVRSTALVEREKDYIAAVKSLGLGDARILLRHLVPNCLPTVIVVAAVQVANAIALEATLSFLGLGLPVTEPSLGLLIANGFRHILSGRTWISTYPGVALVMLIVALNLVGDRLRDLLDPRRQT